jgi:O-antigen ligase
MDGFILFLGLVAALMGLYQWCFGFGQLAQLLPQFSGVDADQLAAAVHNKRAFGPLVTSGALAALMIFTFPQALVRCWTASGSKRIIWGFASLILLAGLAATGGVGAWICLGLPLGFLLYRQGAKVWILGMAAFLAMVLAILLWYRGVHSWALASYSMRLELWHNAWTLFLQKPFFGWGLGTFGEAYQTTGLPLGTGALFAHNLFLQLLVETGSVGLVLFTVALVSLFFRFKWPSRWEGWGVVGGLLAVLLFSLIDLPFQMGELVWVFAGVAGRLDFRPEKTWTLPEISLRCVPWVLLVVLAVTGFWPPYRPWNFALLAVVLWTVFALFEAHISGMKLWMGLGAFYLLVRAFNSSSASGTVWFLELAGLAVVFYLMVPKLHQPKKFLTFFAGLGLVWALKLAWYCWHSAPQNPAEWVHFQITDVEPWIFYPNPKHLGIFLVPLLFLLPNYPGLSFGVKKFLSFLSALVILRLKAMGALVALAVGWLWSARKNRFRFLLGILLAAASLLVLRVLNTSATKWQRFEIWRSALHVWSKDIWCGVGPGVFVSAFHQVQSPRLDGVSRYLMDARYAHNEFLELLTAFGLLGLVFVLALIWEARKTVQEPDCQASLWGIGAASFFDFCLHTPLVALMTAGLASGKENENQKGSLFAALLGMGLSLGLFVSPVFAPALEKQSADRLAAGDGPTALRDQRAATTLNPWDAQVLVRESDFYEQLYLATHDETWRKKADESLDAAMDMEQADGNLALARAKRWSQRYEIHPSAAGLEMSTEAWEEAERVLPLNAFLTFEEGFFWVKAGQLSNRPPWSKDGFGPKTLECYEKSAFLEPNFTAAWMNLGLAQEQAAKAKGLAASVGKENLKKALELYQQWKDAPGLSPEERQLVGLPPAEVQQLLKEVGR